MVKLKAVEEINMYFYNPQTREEISVIQNSGKLNMKAYENEYMIMNERNDVMRPSSIG